MTAKSIFGVVLAVASIALIATGVGAPFGLGTIGIAFGGAFVSDAVLLGVGLGIAGSLLLGPSKPKLDTTLTNNQVNRLTATLIPTTPRKTWFGHTAGDTDVRYQAFTGTNQENLEMIVGHASHEAHSIDELWLDNEIAWTLAGGVQGRYVGYLTVTPRTLGTSANGIAIDSNWTANSTLTGCAYTYLKFKLTGNTDKVSSPFASGVTSRMTVRGKGAKVYDPRLDTTVAGGSGSQRANDQTTWTWDDNASRNPALQELFYELGWKIGGKLAVGKGVPPARLDLASYAVAANACDESVTLSGGGTEPRYRGDGVVSEGDDPAGVRDNLCSAMNAVLRDAGGKLALTVIHNDLGTPVTPSGKSAFDENDVLGELQWDQTPDLNQCFNIVRGRRIDPSDNALYQPVDFPEVSLTSNDGIDRIDPIDYPFVQSNGQAQRLAKQRLERNQYQGRLTFTGGPTFWGLNVGDVFPLTHATFGWTAKLFRVAGQKISRSGETQIVAVEENSAIYAWANNEAAPVTPGTPTIYNPLNNPLVLGIGDSGNSAAPGDSNRVRFSEMENGALGYTVYDTAGTISAIGTGVSSAKNYAHISGTFTANSQLGSLGTSGFAAADAGYRVRVTAGERLLVSLQIGNILPDARCVTFVELVFYDATGTNLNVPAVIYNTAGSVSFPTREAAFVTVPANAVFALLIYYVSNGALGITGSFDLFIAEPMVCGAGNAQTVIPAFSPGPSGESGAQVTKAIVGPAASDVLYDNTGVTFQSANDLTYLVQDANGTRTTNVTMTWMVVSGTFNGKTSADGAQAFTLTSGIANLTPTSLTTVSAILEIDATVNGIAVPSFVTIVTKTLAAATPAGTGGGGAGSTDVASQSSGFTAINTATFTTITSSLTFTLPTGKTTLRCVVDLSCKYPRSADQNGPWDVEFKVQRGGVDQGSTQHSNPDPYLDSSGGLGTITIPGTMQYTLDMTGLTALTQYTVVVQARVASGTLPSASNMGFTGTVTLSAP